ncbi:MAG: DUF2231 domain-containing protein [Candidatus Doudnabacteria bacterium]
MNIHPIFVHFPIALLSTYAVLELIRFKIVKNQLYWFYVKSVLVILGTLGGLASLLTGDIAKELVTDNSYLPLINTHEFWAKTSVVIFSILASGYAVAWIRKYDRAFIKNISMFSGVWQVILRIQVLITDTRLVVVLALAGIAALFITGALGGSIVYGHEGDPVTNWIYRLFVPGS